MFGKDCIQIIKREKNFQINSGQQQDWNQNTKKGTKDQTQSNTEEQLF